MRKLALSLLASLWLVAGAQAQNFTMPPPAGVVVGGYAIVSTCGSQSLTVTQGFGTMDSTGKLCVNATVPNAAAVVPAFSNSTISVTSTWQSLLAANTSRRSCDMQNQGTHVMYFQVTTANAAPTGVAAAKQVQPGQVIFCNAYSGNALQGYVWITGTAGDAYQVTEYQ